MSVVFDGEGKKLKAVQDEMERRRKEAEDRKKGVKEIEASPVTLPVPVPLQGMSQDVQGNAAALSNGHPTNSPIQTSAATNSRRPAGLPARPPPSMHVQPMPKVAIAPSLLRARSMANSSAKPGPFPSSHLQQSGSDSKNKDARSPSSSSSTPLHMHHSPFLRGPGGVGPGRGRPSRLHMQALADDTPVTSRSPSPISRRPGIGGPLSRLSKDAEAKHALVMQELARNGNDYMWIDGAQLSGGAESEEDVKRFFDQLGIDKVRGTFSEGLVLSGS